MKEFSWFKLIGIMVILDGFGFVGAVFIFCGKTAI